MQNRVVRYSGDSPGREAWRRLPDEYDPTSSRGRVTIVGYVEKPTRCDITEDLGVALEGWLAKILRIVMGVLVEFKMTFWRQPCTSSFRQTCVICFGETHFFYTNILLL